MTAVENAEAKVKAANLRILAASQAEHAAAYRRQAQRPIYPAQSGICAGKAAEMDGYAARSLAQAELLEAQAAEQVTT